MAGFTLAQPMMFRVDMRAGLMEQPQRAVLMRGDKLANRVIADLILDNSPMTVDGAIVTGKFTRCADNVDIVLNGEAKGNRVSVALDEHCYAVSGHYELRMRLTVGGEARTILFISGYVERDGEGGILDTEHVIPSLDEIIAQYAEMQRVTRETEDARDQAIAASKQANFTVLDRFDTYAQLIAAHPTGEAGQAFAVGTADDNVVYIWGIDTRSWVNIGPVQGAPGFSPTVTVEEIEGGHRVTITSASGTQTVDVMNGQDLAEYDQPLNTTDDVKFRSVTTTDPLDADTLGGKEAADYALKDSGEEWTFTLEDGTVVTKKVLLGV